MDEDLVVSFLFFFGGGLFCLLFGLIVQSGKMKRWWIAYSTPLTPVAGAYWSIPFSIVLLMMSLILFIPDIEIRRKVFLYVGLCGFVFSIIIAILRPHWLVPAWLRWLEDNHKDILPLLKKEARQMGGIEWDRRVRTQEGLEIWVAEVRHKRKL